MKKYLLLFLAALLAVSCGTGKKQTFSPKERKSSMSDSTRRDAIMAMRAKLGDVNVDSLVMSHGVKFSVVPPIASENVSETASNKLCSKLVQIAAQNGIGGLYTNPVLALIARVDNVDRSMTGTAPQRAVVKCEITLYCANLVSHDIYASCAQTVTGVGASFEDATNKAFNNVKNDGQMQKMLSVASQRALEWYRNPGNVKTLVDMLVNQREYALAMGLLSSVPEQATATFEYAVSKNEEVSGLFFEEKAAELLGKMEGAIAASGDGYDPQVGAYLAAIPVRSGSYARAQELYTEYMTQHREALKEQRIAEMAKEQAKDQHEFEKEMQELEIKKISATYEGEAMIEKYNAQKSQGFFSRLLNRANSEEQQAKRRAREERMEKRGMLRSMADDIVGTDPWFK